MNNRIMHALRGVLTCMAVSLVTESTLAAGFYLTEVGIPGSLGSDGTVNPTNTTGADSAWTNPASMTGLEQDQTFAGMTLLPKIAFSLAPGTTASGTDSGNTGIVSPIPSFFYVNKLKNGRVSVSWLLQRLVGVSITAVISPDVTRSSARNSWGLALRHPLVTG